MAFRTPPFVRPRVVIPVVVVLIVLIVLFTVGTGLYVNLLFFRETGYSGVFTTMLWTKVLLFFLGGLLMAGAVGANAVLAYRLRPPFRPASLEQQNLDRYRIAVQPYLIPLLVVLLVIVAIAAGSAATGHWQTWQLWLNSQSFGHVDPQFHRDVGYYAFTYPFYRFVLSVLFQIVIVSTIVAAVVHYLYGGIRLQTPGDKAVPAAKAHLSVLLGLLLLLKAWAYWLDRFGLNFSTRGYVHNGASYTDIHVILPAKTILLIVSVICAVLFFVNARLRGWMLPAVSVGLLLFASIVIGGIVPAIVQAASVHPNEATKEKPYIARNIAETRYAYQLTDANVTALTYDTSAPIPAAQVRADTGTLPDARVLDPNVLSPTFEQLEQRKNYYGFASPLDIDRYQVGTKLQDFIVSAREVDIAGLDASQRSWINTHLAYTHGVGFVAAPANTTDPLNAGQPDFTKGEFNIPPQGVLNLPLDGSRIYFGERSPTYSIVHTKTAEVDGLDQSNSYAGKGGVGIGGFFRRLVFAAHFKDTNLLLSSSLTGSSRILYYRDPVTRVHKIAPWLTLDSDPYPAVVDNRIVWIVDGYTTSDAFPYSARRSLSSVTADTTGGQQTSKDVNYIRNSVKAVVDATDGTTKLYAWDETDPMLKAWMSVFHGVVLPKSAASQSLRDHFRYPEDLFKVQRDLFATYHVTDPSVFYAQRDAWTVPSDPTVGGGIAQPPYYLVSQLPDQTAPTFNLTTTYVALKRPNLTAYLSVASGGVGAGSDPQSQFGQMTLLRLTKEGSGPEQAQQAMNTFPDFTRDESLFRQGNSRVIEGNLLSLPVGNGFVYVEPVYLTGSSSSFPKLKKVLVFYNGNVGYSDTIQAALNAAILTPQGGSTTSSPTPTPSGSVTPSASPTPSSAPTSTAPTPGSVQDQLRQLLQQQSQIDAKLQQLLDQLASSKAPSKAPSPSPSR